MLVALGILLSLVSFCPVMLTIDGPILPNVVPILVAIGLILTGIRLQDSEAARFLRIMTPFMILTAFVAAWILLQMLPIPLWQTDPLAKISKLAHPVWASTAAGFSKEITGSITVDTGATFVAFVHFVSFVGIVLLSTAVTINRDRAESVLVSLAIATALIALIIVLAEMLGGSFLATREEASICAALGVSLSAATTCLIFDRQSKQRPRQNARWPMLSNSALACLAAFFLCVMAIAISRSGSLLFATAGGFGTFCAVMLIRRLDLGRWGAWAIGITALVIAAAVITGAAGTSTDLRLAFVKKDAAAIELTQRILADAPLLGDGAGTFGSILPIYQLPDPKPGEFDAVTGAAKISIELGRPMMWIICLAALAGTLVLLRGVANRHRDFFYPATGAAVLVTLIILSFINVGVLGPVVAMLAGTALGLGLAQSQSQGSSDTTALNGTAAGTGSRKSLF